ncbi:MFS transporter [Bordetella genomosp. 1]|uniref:MFS transporter n=1 Tax=Bordetella genomosp. 1 TaxID=1395607 RepID=A0A261SPR4_9BORD|nr:MFS transporter [Bordetella genomosp. 1]OZI39135.1 MFS transporter [Bordetella genomosp. 1]OZI65357.1 MFS transporter [Bordetella genomosp. 1]
MPAGLRVFLFFSLGYLISYVFRGLNIGFGPYLTSELSLSAADLGTLTSLYFLGFALMQIPAGLMLDTWGPRRVNATMLVVAAVGTLVYGMSTSLTGLMVGRLLIGAGVCVCLGATFQALAHTFALARLPGINGLVMAVGGLGGVLVGTPLSALLEHTTWRMVSIGMAGATLVVATLIWFGSPRETGPARAPVTLASQWRGTWTLLTSAHYWRLASLPVMTGGVFYGVQSLWVRPYLIEVNGLDAVPAAWLVSLLGLAMMAGNIGLGLAARRVERMGLGLYGFGGLCMVLFLVFQLLIILRVPLPLAALWAGYGIFGSANILVYALLAGEFPRELLGRVASTTNLLMFLMIFLCQIGVGWVVDLWPGIMGGFRADAHIAAWVLLLAAQAGAAVWYFWPRRRVAPA